MTTNPLLVQHQELKITGNQPKLKVPQSPGEAELAVALLQEASEESASSRPRPALQPQPPSTEAALPFRLNVGVDVTKHLAGALGGVITVIIC